MSNYIIRSEIDDDKKLNINIIDKTECISYTTTIIKDIERIKKMIEKCIENENENENYKYEIRRCMINENIILELEIRYEFVNIREEITLEKIRKEDLENLCIKNEIRIEELEKKNIKLEEKIEGSEERINDLDENKNELVERIEGLENKIEELEEGKKELEERITELEDKIIKYSKINNKNIYLSRKDYSEIKINVDYMCYNLWDSSSSSEMGRIKYVNILMIKDNNLDLIMEYLLNNNVFYFRSQFMEQDYKNKCVVLYDDVYEYLIKNNNELLERIKKEISEIKIFNKKQ